MDTEAEKQRDFAEMTPEKPVAGGECRIREFMPADDAPPDVGLSVVAVDGWDPVLAYRQDGVWYESPHDALDESVTHYLELFMDDLGLPR